MRDMLYAVTVKSLHTGQLEKFVTIGLGTPFMFLPNEMLSLSANIPVVFVQ